MKTSIETQPLIRELKKVIDGITSNFRNTIAQCIKAGELLTKIRSKTKHGDWEDVLSTVGLNFRTAQRWMALWEHRSELKLAEIKTVSDAYNFLWPVGTIPEKNDTNTIATSQNEPLTSEKTSHSTPEKRSILAGDSSVQGDIRELGSANEKTTALPNKARALSGDNLRAYLSHAPAKAKEPEIHLDKVGRPIPEAILERWNRAYEVGSRLRSIVSDVKCELEKGIGKDLIFAELINSVISDATALHYSLSQILPYSVCPTCQGKVPEKCRTCHTRGFISKFYYDGPAVGSDLRKMVEKQAKQYASQTISA